MISPFTFSCKFMHSCLEQYILHSCLFKQNGLQCRTDSYSVICTIITPIHKEPIADYEMRNSRYPMARTRSSEHGIRRRAGSAVLVSLVLIAGCAPVAGRSYDVLITGGLVVDGTGAPGIPVDMGIRDGVIAAGTVPSRGFSALTCGRRAFFLWKWRFTK